MVRLIFSKDIFVKGIIVTMIVMAVKISNGVLSLVFINLKFFFLNMSINQEANIVNKNTSAAEMLTLEVSVGINNNGINSGNK